MRVKVKVMNTRISMSQSQDRVVCRIKILPNIQVQFKTTIRLYWVRMMIWSQHLWKSHQLMRSRNLVRLIVLQKSLTILKVAHKPHLLSKKIIKSLTLICNLMRNHQSLVRKVPNKPLKLVSQIRTNTRLPVTQSIACGVTWSLPPSSTKSTRSWQKRLVRQMAPSHTKKSLHTRKLWFNKNNLNRRKATRRIWVWMRILSLRSGPLLRLLWQIKMNILNSLSSQKGKFTIWLKSSCAR